MVDYVDRSNRELLLALHGPGVVDGLQVRLTTGSTVNVAAGVAVDPLGRLVTLDAPARIPITRPFTGRVVLRVEERPADPVATVDGTVFTAIETVVDVVVTTTPDPDQLVLARYVAGRRVRGR